MFQRVAAALLTGPVGFLVAGVIDVVAFTSVALRDAARRRWASR